MSKCKDPGQTALDLRWDHMTDWKKVTVRSGTRGAHPAHLVLLGISAVAKYACSTVY